MNTAQVPRFGGIHHLKFPVSDLERSLKFYESVLGAHRIVAFDHRHTRDGALYAYILEVPDLGIPLELRLDPEAARKQRHFDPVTFAVDSRAALVEWDHALTARSVPHSRVLAGVKGWLLVFEDPDQRRLRFYTRESHGPEVKPDEGDPWIVAVPST
jgi:catechol 2,3-dioxygenase-like lactoylglutathione lyase family enzyme